MTTIGKKCKMAIGGKSYDINNGGFAMRVPDVSDKEWEELIGPHYTLTFTSKISGQDARRLSGYYFNLFCPPVDLYRWQYRRQVLNPRYGRYRRHLGWKK